MNRSLVFSASGIGEIQCSDAKIWPWQRPYAKTNSKWSIDLSKHKIVKLLQETARRKICMVLCLAASFYIADNSIIHEGKALISWTSSNLKLSQL